MKHIKYHLPIVHLVLLTLFLCLAQSLAGAQNIYFTGFEPGTFQGWSVDNGIWHVGTPTSGPKAAYDGTQCAETGPYQPGLSSRLVSPVISLPSIASGQQITLSFYQWFNWDLGGSYRGSGDVQVSTNGGTTWTTVSIPASSGIGYNGPSGGWDLASVDLSAYAGQKIQIAFQHVGGSNAGIGWYVDDVSVDKVKIQNLPYYQTFENFTGLPQDWYGWSADNGVWQVGTPKGGPGSAYDGNQCAGTGLAGTYAANQTSRLISPPMLLPSIASGQQITLSFYQWFNWDLGGSYRGSGDVQVSTWNGTVWSNWTTVNIRPSSGIGYNGPSGGWDLVSIDLSAYAGKQIQFGFEHHGGSNAGIGWYIDDVSVVVEAIPYLPLNQTIGFENFTGLPQDWYGWSADNGVWQVGTPTGGPGSAYDGNQCAGTGLAGTYAANQTSRLISPPVNLTAIASGQPVTLSFYQWFNWDLGGSYRGSGDVQVSTWNGAAWSNWTTVSNSYSGNSGGWSNLPASVDLSTYAGKLIQIAFEHHGGSNPGIGWYIDDVEVVTPPTPPTISSVTFSSPTTLCPQMTTTGTVTLNEAVTSKTQVKLASSNSTALSVPASITILAGNNTGTFTATARAVTSNTTATVTATLGSSSATSPNVTVEPWVQSISVSPTSVVAGSQATATITLNLPAPSGGLAVTLASSSSIAAFVDATGKPITSVKAPAGATTVTATVATYATATTTTVTLSASNQGASQTCTLTVTAGGAKLVLSPTSVTGGIYNSTGFVTLTAPAPAGGATVSLKSNNPAASVPTTVTVAAGESTAFFTITTAQVPKTTVATITATYGGVSSSAKLTLLPIATLSIIPSTVRGGNNAIGLILLNGWLATSNVNIPITSSNPKVASPDQTSVVIPTGSNLATFDISTFPVTKATTVTFTATVNGTKITATLKVTP